MTDLTGVRSRAHSISDDWTVTGINLTTGRAELWAELPCTAPVAPLCVPLNSTQAAWAQQATALLCTEVRDSVETALANNEFGVHTNTVNRGRHFPEFHDGNAQYHIYLGHQNPGLTGRWDFPPRDTITDFQQQLRQLAGTMAHEFFHHLYPGERHYVGPTGGINARTKACVPGYTG